MKTTTKLRLAARAAGGALGASYKIGKLVGGAQPELTGGRRAIVVWAPVIGGLSAGFALAYFLDRENGRRRRAALGSKLSSGGSSPRPQAANGTPNDPTLARKVETEIFRDADVPKSKITVSVANGVVSLRGEVDSPAQRSDLRDAAEKVEGVSEVIDLLHLEGEPAPNKETALGK